MANRQIGWTNEANLLYQISALITRLTQVTAANSGTIGLTSVGLSVPSAFSLANNPLIENGTIAITGAGTVSQYIDGTGALQTFPSLTGYVPYTGATSPVNLGAYDLTVNGLTVGRGGNQFDTNTTVLGYQAFETTSTAANITAIGTRALRVHTSGNSNTAIGTGAMQQDVNGVNNTAVGGSAFVFFTNSANTGNTGIGATAGGRLVSGNYNTFVGASLAPVGILTSGSFNTILGAQVNVGVASLSNNIILADGQGNIKYRWNGTDNTITGDLNVTGVLKPTVTTNRQTASYTLALSDRGKLVEMNVASANNLTVPLDSVVAFPIGTQLEVAQYGAGQTTIVATSGVTIRSASGNLKIAAQYVAVSLIKVATNEWYCFGNLSA